MLSAQVHDSTPIGLSLLTHVAGTQVFSAEPSSLTASPTAIDHKKKPMPKRRRSTEANSDTESSSSHPPARTRDGPKKKKANRACFHCQKAHLTCDDCESLLHVLLYSHTLSLFYTSDPRATSSAHSESTVRSLLSVKEGDVRFCIRHSLPRPRFVLVLRVRGCTTRPSVSSKICIVRIVCPLSPPKCVESAIQKWAVFDSLLCIVENLAASEDCGNLASPNEWACPLHVPQFSVNHKINHPLRHPRV